MTQKNQLNDGLTKDSNQKNEEYFKSFVRTRGGVHVLTVAPAGLFVSLLCLAITWNTAVYAH